MPESHPPYPLAFRRQMVELVGAERLPEAPAPYGTGGHGSGSSSFLSGWFATSGMVGFASLASWG